MKALVVDPSPELAELFSLLLERTGHESRFCSDPAEALQAAKKFRPDVVLLDLFGPTLEGYAIAHKLRSEVGLDGSKIIMISATIPDQERMRNSGIDRHLLKPVSVQTLLQELWQSAA